MIQRVIARGSSRNQIIDFSDNLVAANEEQYAMIHGAGGAKFAPKSTIRCTICDFSKGKGDLSVTVAANLSPETIEALYEASKRDYSVPSAVPVNTSHSLTTAGVQSLNASMDAIQTLWKLLKNEKTTRKELAETVQKAGNNLSAAVKTLQTAKSGESTETQPYVYKYAQDRVNVYAKDSANRSPMSRLLITRKASKDKSGKDVLYPWTFSIVSGMCEVQTYQNGAQGCKSGTFQKQKEVTVSISDADMYRMMLRCVRFIHIWEHAQTQRMIQGKAKADRERMEHKKAQEAS